MTHDPEEAGFLRAIKFPFCLMAVRTSNVFPTVICTQGPATKLWPAADQLYSIECSRVYILLRLMGVISNLWNKFGVLRFQTEKALGLSVLWKLHLFPLFDSFSWTHMIVCIQ